MKYLGDIDEAQDVVDKAYVDTKVAKVDTYEIIAHRGFANVNVENTIVAMQNALTQGADSLEIDIQTSSNGTLWLYHDTTVNSKTNGTGTFTSLTDSYISGLRYTEADGTSLEGIGIGLVSELIDSIKDRDFHFIVAEIKEYNNQSTDIANMVNTFKDAGLGKRISWQSFNYSDLTVAHSVDPSADFGYIMSTSGNEQAELEAAVDNLSNDFSSSTLSLNYLLWQDYPSVVEYAKSRGVKVAAWTINERAVAQEMLDLGITKIITDYNIRGIR